MVFRPHHIEPAEDADEPGCDVWLEGRVRRDARRYLHPERRVPIAVVSVEITVERMRRGSLARMLETVEVQVAIPVTHPDLPKLLRRGNLVRVEGMLERVIVPLRADDEQVQRAVADLDQRWESDQSGNTTSRQDERRYARQRASLQQTLLTRVVAGYVGCWKVRLHRLRKRSGCAPNAGASVTVNRRREPSSISPNYRAHRTAALLRLPSPMRRG